MSTEFRIISIGALSKNLLWGENSPVRTQHATITLVVTAERRILVDPSLPGEILAAKFFERTGKMLDWVTDVFCTTLRPDARRGLSALSHANFYAGELELEWYARRLEELAESADRLESEESSELDAELQMLQHFKPAPEKFDDQVTLYPLYGPTPGCCGLLLTPPTNTVLITGPAVLTAAHIEKGMIWEESADQEAAMESFQEVFELADLIVPGFDNLCFNPIRIA